MAEYIEREAVYRKACKGCTRHGDEVGSCSSEEPCDCLLYHFVTAPAADVAPVVPGRWKYYHKQNKAVCTNCSFERDLDANFGRAISCPNCGAKMDVTDINVGDKEGG